MSNSNNSMAKIGKYLREVSVVVIGVAITLSVSVWINNNSEKRNLILYLKTIKMELEGNADNFEWYSKWLQKSAKYADYLKANDKNSLNKDTLDYYSYTDNNGCGYMNFSPLTDLLFMKNAYEMFKNSGTMSQLKDKELLLSLWSTYSQLEHVKNYLEKYFLIKEEEARRELQLKADGKTVAVPMQVFYSTDLPYKMVEKCEDASELIRKTLSKLEESKILK